MIFELLKDIFNLFIHSKEFGVWNPLNISLGLFSIGLVIFRTKYGIGAQTKKVHERKSASGAEVSIYMALILMSIVLFRYAVITQELAVACNAAFTLWYSSWVVHACVKYASGEIFMIETEGWSQRAHSYMRYGFILVCIVTVIVTLSIPAEYIGVLLWTTLVILLVTICLQPLAMIIRRSTRSASAKTFFWVFFTGFVWLFYAYKFKDPIVWWYMFIQTVLCAITVMVWLVIRQVEKKD